MARYSKLIAALIGAITVAVAQGVIPDSAAKWVTVILAFLTALGVYAVPNAPSA